jgi:Leucine-rich repeat (LRR) protein
MSNILDQFLKPLATPVAYLDLYLNHLTFVPDQIKQFDQVVRVDLEYNEIPVIRTGDFVFETKLERLVLAGNNISVIEPGAFQGKTTYSPYLCSNLMTQLKNHVFFFYIIGVYGNQSEIDLDRNNIRRFESGVFKSVLEQMAPFGGYNSPPRSFTYISMYDSTTTHKKHL